MDVIQPLPQDCIQGRLAEVVEFEVLPIKDELTEAPASGAHSRAHRGTELATQVPSWEAAKGKLSRNLGEDLL